MIELIKVLNETKGQYLAGYIIFALIFTSIVVGGIVEIVKYLSKKNSKSSKETE